MFMRLSLTVSNYKTARAVARKKAPTDQMLGQ
jgi:hypothetical protein